MEKKAIHQYIGYRGNSNILQILCVLLLLAVNGVLSSPPTIVPNESDVTVMLYENVRLNCIANEPIYWRFHKAVYDFDIMQNTHVNANHNHDNKYTYESILDLNRVDSTYVDYYYCVKNTSEPNASIETLLRQQQAAQIYVFAEDRRHPLVSVSVPDLEGNQFDELIIPCKPSSKNFEVQLFKEGDERREVHSPFSPNEGYRLKLNSTSDAGRYVCHAKLDLNEKFDIYFTVKVNRKPPRSHSNYDALPIRSNQGVGSNILSEPRIALKQGHLGIENEPLELECTVTVASMTNRLEMKWELPNENIAEKENRIRMFPTVFQKLDSSPQSFQAFGKLIVKNWDRKKDAGTYQCILNDANRVRLAALNVKGTSEFRAPQINLTDVFYKVGERINVNCDITSIPASKVSWSFAPCDNVDIAYTCEDSNRIAFNETAISTFPLTPSTQRSTLNFLPKGMGTIYCEATNDEGRTEERANVFVIDADEGFTIRNENGMPVVAGDNVSIVCEASAFKYRDIDWYKADALVENTTNIEVISKKTLHTLYKELHFKPIESEAAGRYVCRAAFFGSNSFVNKSRELHVMEPMLPTKVSSNVDRSRKYRLNDNAKLLCKFSGIPNPTTIKWFKNNQEIIPIANSKHLTMSEDRSVLTIHLNADDEGIYRCDAENRAGKVSREMELIIENVSTSAACTFTPTSIAAVPLSGMFIICSLSRLGP